MHQLCIKNRCEVLCRSPIRSNYKVKKNYIAHFHGWGSTVSRLEPLRGGNLLFTTKLPEIPGTHFINLGKMKG